VESWLLEPLRETQIGSKFRRFWEIGGKITVNDRRGETVFGIELSGGSRNRDSPQFDHLQLLESTAYRSLACEQAHLKPARSLLFYLVYCSFRRKRRHTHVISRLRWSLILCSFGTRLDEFLLVIFKFISSFVETERPVHMDALSLWKYSYRKTLHHNYCKPISSIFR